MKMNNQLFTLFILIISMGALQGQVLMQEYLSQDHSGVLQKSVNFPSENLEHKWEHQSTEGLKSTYLLSLYHDGKKINTYEVRMRNLNITFYVEIRMASKKEGSVKTLSGIYDKGGKWMRVKMAPHNGCKRDDATWKRFNRIESFDQILENIIQQMDANVILECYSE